MSGKLIKCLYLKNHEVIKICPELLAGMSTPRACAELVNGVVMDAAGKDLFGEIDK